MKTKELIQNLLNRYPTLKDSDSRLMANFWDEELKRKNKDVKHMSAAEFLELFAQSKLTNPESIRRMRAKLQEEKPSLRGRVYSMRKSKIQDKWRTKLGYNNG